MCRCAHCDGRFFKLIETRCLPLALSGENAVSLFYKKRCKRCKMKNYFRRDFYADGTPPVTKLIGGEDWARGVKQTFAVEDGGRMTVFASEYSKRVARGADKALEYSKQGYVTGGGHAQSA